MSKIKILLSGAIFFVLLIATSIIKNQTRVIEKKLNLLSSQILLKEKDINESQLDFFFLTSPSQIEKKITKVKDLVEIIEKSKKKKFGTKINPCTKTFQALRIFVNKEITELINGIINAAKILKPGGRILIVSFHSIEDKIAKYFFSNFSKNKSKPSRYFPEKDYSNTAIFEDYKNKVLKPTKKEINKNNRSRSAKLRYAVRSKNKFVYPHDLIEKFKNYLNLEAINV